MKLVAYLLAGIAVGIGVAWWQLGGAPADALDSAAVAGDRAPLERRLSALETELALERYERQALAEELEGLKAGLADSTAAAASPEANPGNPRERIAALLESDGGGPALERLRERFPDGLPGPGGFDESVLDQRRIERFVAAGFAPERAQWLLQREDELEMQVLQSRYEATQNGASAQEVANLSTSQLMREELGDAEYAKYLTGLGRPTSVNVRDVLTNSPAQIAGLAPGDEIVGYAGQRVFDMNELNNLTYEGNPGETVAIDILRDGQPMTLYVERGPIGVSGGGRSIRRRP
jgi:PDZ domain